MLTQVKNSNVKTETIAKTNDVFGCVRPDIAALVAFAPVAVAVRVRLDPPLVETLSVIVPVLVGKLV